MKFIDLYNKNKDTADFKFRNHRFKTWCYLMKREPKKYKVEWDNIGECFKFYKYYPQGLYKGWQHNDNTSGRYNLMYKYEKSY